MDIVEWKLKATCRIDVFLECVSLPFNVGKQKINWHLSYVWSILQSSEFSFAKEGEHNIAIENTLEWMANAKNIST